MRINFNKIIIDNFMSFEHEEFDFNNMKGLTLVCGKNNDIPGSKNGTGKCVDEKTKIIIKYHVENKNFFIDRLTNDDVFFIKNVEKEINSNKIYNDYEYIIGITTIKDIFDFFHAYSEIKRPVYVLCPVVNHDKNEFLFEWNIIGGCEITARNSDIITIETDNNYSLSVSPEHLLLTYDNRWIKAKELTKDTLIYTFEYGHISRLRKTSIKRISNERYKKDLYDIEVLSNSHAYFSNGFISHNSTLFNALTFGLFGDMPNNIKNESIRNRNTTKKEVSVTVYFSVESCDYKIISGFNKYKNSFCNLFLLNNDEEVDLTKSSIAETYKFLENNILHFDMSIFLRTILLTSDNQYNFFRLKKNDKKEFIEKLFDIAIFGDMYDLIHKDILSLDKSIVASQNILMTLNRNNDVLSEKMEKYNNDKIKKLEYIKSTLLNLNNEREKLLNTNIQNHSDESKKFEIALDKINTLIEKIRRDISNNDNLISMKEVKLIKFKTQRESKLEKIKSYDTLINKLCDKCINIVKEYYNIIDINNDIEYIEENINEINQELSKLKDISKEYTLKLNDYNDKAEKISKKIYKLTGEFNKFSLDMSRLDMRINNEQSNYNKLEQEENPFLGLLNENNEKKNIESENLEKTKEKYKYLKFAENIVSHDTLKQFIIKDLIHILNNKITIYLNKLGSNYSCVFDSNMNYTFNTITGECEYDSFSSGEKMRLNIAVSLAFRDFMAMRSNLVSNILILDEYIDSNIDSLAIEGIINIIKEFVIIYNQNIFVISHRKEIDNSIFDNIVQIQKTNSISKIKYLT